MTDVSVAETETVNGVSGETTARNISLWRECLAAFLCETERLAAGSLVIFMSDLNNVDSIISILLTFHDVKLGMISFVR